MIDQGDSPGIFRAFNFILHALNTWLFLRINQSFWSQQSLKKDEVIWLSWGASLVYLLHPVQVESVLWISSMRTLLGSFFAFLSIFFLLKHEFSPHQKEVSFSEAPAIYAPTLLSYFLGLLSNPTMAPALIFGGLLIFIAKKRISRATLLLIMLTAIATLLIVTFTHEKDILTTYFDNLSAGLRLKLIFISLSTYLINILTPLNLVFDYQINAFSISFLNETSQLGIKLFLSPLLIIYFSVSFFNEKLKESALLMAGFFLLILPHVGIILHDFNNISIVSDRYLNLALAGFALFISYTLLRIHSWLKSHQKWLPTYLIPILILISLTFLTGLQITKWKNPTVILNSSQKLLSLRAPTLIALGNQFAQKENYKMARHAFKDALASEPDSTAALLSLIKVNELSFSEKEDKFIESYISSNQLTINSELALPLAKVWVRRHRFNDALDLISMSLERSNKTKKEAYLLRNQIEVYKEEYAFKALENLQSYHASKGQLKESLKYLEKMILLRPLDQKLLRKRRILLQELKY